jgi:hypothetical protein
LRLLRRAARLPYHPIVWRLNRNFEHANLRASAVEARLGDLDGRERAVEARLTDMQMRLEDWERQLERWAYQMQHSLGASRDLIDAAQRTIRETRAANDVSREAIAEWSAVIARELGPNGHSES